MITTQAQIRSAFWESLPDFLVGDERVFHRGWRQNQYPCDTRLAFIDFVDQLRRNGEISEALANRVTL